MNYELRIEKAAAPKKATTSVRRLTDEVGQSVVYYELQHETDLTVGGSLVGYLWFIQFVFALQRYGDFWKQPSSALTCIDTPFS